jgi:signal transduction histidine kinase
MGACGDRRTPSHTRQGRVRDDGKDIDQALAAAKAGRAHYGLRGMPERAAVIGGRLTVRSEPDAGTEVELRVA